MTPPKGKAKGATAPLDSTLGDDAPAEPATSAAPVAELGIIGEGVLEGVGMGAVALETRRYGLSGAAFIATAAGQAEDARGNQGSDLICLAVEPGRLGEYVELLRGMGAILPAAGE